MMELLRLRSQLFRARLQLSCVATRRGLHHPDYLQFRIQRTKTCLNLRIRVWIMVYRSSECLCSA